MCFFLNSLFRSPGPAQEMSGWHHPAAQKRDCSASKKTRWGLPSPGTKWGQGHPSPLSLMYLNSWCDPPPHHSNSFPVEVLGVGFHPKRGGHVWWGGRVWCQLAFGTGTKILILGMCSDPTLTPDSHPSSFSSSQCCSHLVSTDFPLKEDELDLESL